jgi:uracil-DNA glycosylase
MSNSAPPLLQQFHWPEAWHAVLPPESLQLSGDLLRFLAHEYATHTVFPPPQDVFQAFALTAPETLRVVILGQDPYHNDGQAHGLAFSVNPGTKTPPSLRNIFRELQEDMGCSMPEEGDLRGWASQGVLLLNTVLTVRAHAAASHQKKGWEAFTDQMISTLSAYCEHLVFILWGNAAHKKQNLIHERHTVLTSVHPSPLSARRGFFGSQPFSQTNQALTRHQQAPIQWCKTNIQGDPV